MTEAFRLLLPYQNLKDVTDWFSAVAFSENFVQFNFFDTKYFYKCMATSVLFQTHNTMELIKRHVVLARIVSK